MMMMKVFISSQSISFLHNPIHRLIHLPPPFQRERFEFPQGGGGGIFAKPDNLKMKCVKIILLEFWAFGLEGGAGSKKKSLPWGRYGYFLKSSTHYTFFHILPPSLHSCH